MTDQLSVLKLVTERIDAAGIAYMLTGSIAAGYYAQPRMTRDIDLVVELELADAERIAGVFAPEFNCEEFRRRRHVEIGGHPLWIVSPEDLILSKLAWAKTSRSEMQLRDVRQLLTSVPTLDQTYLDHWAANLTVTDLLREVRA